MRRVITGLLALALALVTATAMKNADILAGNCRSVSLRYRQPLSTGQVEAAEEKQPGLTFWCEETAELDGGWRRVEATVLLFKGDASLVLGADCVAGSLPAPLDSGGCAVSTALAWQLFGSEDAVGLTLSQEKREYTVRGVFESEEPVALLPVAEASFTAVELPAEAETSVDPVGWADTRLVQSGLPEPDWRLYAALPAALARLLAWLPLLFGAVVLVVTLIRRAASLPFPTRDGVFFALLGAAALALPVFFSVWPSWLTPSRWSDFSWWSQTAGQLKEMAEAFLSAPPAGRDLALKTGLLAQVALALAQAALCETLRCRLWASQSPAERPDRPRKAPAGAL